jgi:transposase, IS30 family
MRTYKQLNLGQRYQIEALKKAGMGNKDIALLIEKSTSTVSRELRRNGTELDYVARQAQVQVMQRRRQSGRSTKINAHAIQLVREGITNDYSPEQTSGWLKLKHDIAVSHEWIYQYIAKDKREGGDLYTHLRQAGKRRKRYGAKDTRGQLCNRVSIEQRPDIVDKKTRIGDWEIDTVIGQNHKGALVTLVERKSKYTLIAKVDSKHAKGVTTATVRLLKPHADRLFTITADNGKEFAGHESIAAQLNAKVFFAHPYSSYERGLNENTNGLIRQYFPKGSSFDDITEQNVITVMHRLNHRPRKTLNYQTPHAVFFAKNDRKAA